MVYKYHYHHLWPQAVSTYQEMEEEGGGRGGGGSTEEEGGEVGYYCTYLPSIASPEVSSVNLSDQIPSSMCRQEQSSCQRREA